MRKLKQKWTENMKESLENDFKNRYSGKWILQSRNQPETTSFSKVEIFNELKLNQNKKTVVLFFFIIFGMQIYFMVMISLRTTLIGFIKLLITACFNDKVNWLIKLHIKIFGKEN